MIDLNNLNHPIEELKLTSAYVDSDKILQSKYKEWFETLNFYIKNDEIAEKIALKICNDLIEAFIEGITKNG